MVPGLSVINYSPMRPCTVAEMVATGTIADALDCDTDSDRLHRGRDR